MAIEAAVMLRVDRGKMLREQPGAGHNRWHPEIRPRAAVEVGQVVGIETVDAMDGQIKRGDGVEEMKKRSEGAVHSLTGPIFVKGAEAGDLLEVKILEIVPEKTGFTSFGPGFGYLKEEFGAEGFLVHWEMAGGFAISREMPGVRVPACCHMGVMGVAPSLELMKEIEGRERKLGAEGWTVVLPGAEGAVPADAKIAATGLRTISPHEGGGNLDIKQLGAGATLRLPVFVEGALFSTGDAHFAQGDGEVCGTAIEMGATVYVTFGLVKGAARKGRIRNVQWFREREAAARSGKVFATTGRSDNERASGRATRAEDLNMAMKNALLNMVDYLVSERGLTRQQAYVLCSVAVDFKVSQVVDLPNFLVSAVLPLEVFV